MKLSIVIIGAEILLGQVADTNSGTISRALGKYGWETVGIRTVDDSEPSIRKAIEESLEESDLVVCTGGLGPTRDDITKGVLMEIFGGELREDAEVKVNVERIFAERRLQMNVLTLAQALVPSSCSVIPNRYGTAPGMWFEKGQKTLISLPGVPFETEGILSDGLLTDKIRDKYSPDVCFRHATLMVAGISESALAGKLEQFENSLPDGIHLAYLPTPGLLRLRLDGRGTDAPTLKKEFNAALDELKRALGSLMIYDGDADAAEILLSLLRKRNLSFASAESCTGGNIAHAITLVPGCSDVYLGSVVSYANEVKENLLDVNYGNIELEGAVSEPVVRQMVAGVMAATGARAAVATSGIAGPGGAVPGKPVGTVWIAAGFYPEGAETPIIHAAVFRFPGKRERVINRATTAALLMLAEMLR